MAPVSNKELLDIQATIDCRCTLKRVRDMIITESYPSVLLQKSAINEKVKKIFQTKKDFMNLLKFDS